MYEHSTAFQWDETCAQQRAVKMTWSRRSTHRHDGERVVDLPAELRGRVAVELGRLLRAPRAMLRGLDRQGRSGQ